MNKSFSVRIDIPDTDLYNTDIEEIIYQGLKPIILDKIEKTDIDVIELDTLEEQHQNHTNKQKEK
jgi:citrate lyase beta subunit